LRTFEHEKGYGQRLGWGSRPALLIIDVCTGYWTNGCNLDLSRNPEAVTAPDSMRRLLVGARAGNYPIIWAQVRYNHPAMKDAGVQILKSKTIQVWQDGDTRGYDAWLPGLTADPEDTVIYKRNPSAFFGTTLATELQTMNVDTLVICGVSTSGCVRASTMDAICHGFRPMVRTKS
jgi:nicotinamidase-related amidase